MKSKKVLLLVIAVPVLLTLWFICRTTGILEFYSVPTPAMEPTIKVGDRIFSSNLLTPHDNDIICYSTMEHGRKTVYVKRLVGLPGEVLEIKNGLVYCNGKLADDTTKLKREYIISQKVYLLHQELFHENDFISNGDSVAVMLTAAQLNLFKPEERPRFYINILQDRDNWFYSSHPGWTIDNMGPFTVPKDSCFVMGDYRHNSLDSRYTGFVALKDVKGVVLNRK